MSSPCPSATKCLLFQGFHPSHDQLPLDAKQHHWADMQADMLRVQQVLTDAHSLHHTAYHGSRRLQKVSTSCGDPGQQGIIASVLAVVERELADKARLSSCLQEGVLDSLDVLGTYLQGMPTLHQQHQQQMARTEGQDTAFGKGPWMWQHPSNWDMAGGFPIHRGDDRPGNMSPNDFSDTTLRKLHALQLIHEHVNPEALHVLSGSGDQLQALQHQLLCQQWEPQLQQELEQAMQAIVTEYHHRHRLLVELWNMLVTLGIWLKSYITSSLVLRWHTRWLLGMEVDVPADWLYRILKAAGDSSSCVSYQIWRWDPAAISSRRWNSYSSSGGNDSWGDSSSSRRWDSYSSSSGNGSWGDSSNSLQSCLCIASGVNAVSFMWHGVLAEPHSRSPVEFHVASECSPCQYRVIKAMAARANHRFPCVRSPGPVFASSASVLQASSPSPAQATATSPGPNNTKLPRPSKRPPGRTRVPSNHSSPSPGPSPSPNPNPSPNTLPEVSKQGCKKKHTKTQQQRQRGKAAATAVGASSGQRVTATAELIASRSPAVNPGPIIISSSNTQKAPAAEAAAAATAAGKAVLQTSRAGLQLAAAASTVNTADAWDGSRAPVKAPPAAVAAPASGAASGAAPSAVAVAAAAPAVAGVVGDPRAAAAVALAKAGAWAVAGEAEPIMGRTTSYAAAAAAGKESARKVAPRQLAAPRRVSTDPPAGNSRSSRSGSNGKGISSSSSMNAWAAKGLPGFFFPSYAGGSRRPGGYYYPAILAPQSSTAGRVFAGSAAGRTMRTYAPAGHRVPVAAAAPAPAAHAPAAAQLAATAAVVPVAIRDAVNTLGPY